jgi:hypothetical protein
MPSQKLKSKTRIGSKGIRVYGEPKSPFQRLTESEEAPRKTKDSLSAQFALYNPVELQHNANKAILRLETAARSAKPHYTQGANLALVTFSK